MPTPNAERATLPVEIFVPPSDEAERLLRSIPGLVAQAPASPQGPARLLRDALVAPFTQLTFLSFDLQAFLFEVFHTTRWARAGHLFGMTGVNLFAMAGLSQLSAGIDGIDLGALYAGALLCWYAVVSRDARLALWWAAMVPVVLGLYSLAGLWLQWTAGFDSLVASPWLWVAASAVMISTSHIPEPRLPPRAGDPLRWMSIREFVLGPPGRPRPLGAVIPRAIRIALLPISGTIDELWAAPRLLPYNVLFLMFQAGYAPARRAELHDRAVRAIASGQPALDFVGIGGGRPLPRPDDR